MLRTMCEVQLKDRKRADDLMLGLNEMIDQLAMTNSVHWYGHVLRRALDFEAEGRPKRTWKKQVEEESMNVGVSRKDPLCRSKWVVGVSQIAAGLR